MSAKNLDKHNRFRSITVGFRVSPEEHEHINVAVALSGLSKQEYCYRRCLGRDIVVQGDPKVYKALKDQLALVLEELKRIDAGQGISDELLENINLISEFYEENSANIELFMRRMNDPGFMPVVSMEDIYVGSTVGITTSVTTNVWGFQTTSAASGSGFIISTDGYILTNHHVIDDADSITVSLFDGTTYDAALIGYDESNDIAVLKVNAENLSPVILGDSDLLNVVDQVLAIGNPLGELTFSLTSGLVSAMDRKVTLSSTVTMNLIQTDCAINSGNSGGALFNLYGEVIGVTNAKYSSSSSSEASIDNIGFAIPINSIRSIVESIIEKGYIASPYIGVSVLDVSEEMKLYGIPAGIAIQSVAEGSPAEAAGVQIGDVITAVNETAMDSDALVDFVGSSKIGNEIILSVYRQGENLTITITVGEQIQSALANEEKQQNQSMPQGQFVQPGNPFGSFGGRN